MIAFRTKEPWSAHDHEVQDHGEEYVGKQLIENYGLHEELRGSPTEEYMTRSEVKELIKDNFKRKTEVSIRFIVRNVEAKAFRTYPRETMMSRNMESRLKSVIWGKEL